MSFGIPVRNGLGVGLLASTFLSSLRIGGRPAMSLDFIGTNSLDSRVTFTRASTATFIGSNGLIQTAAINDPRFDYNPSTLAPKGLLIEEQRANIQYPSNPNSATFLWNGVNSGAQTLGQPSPDGGNNATLVTSNGGGESGYRATPTFANSTTYTWSVYVKRGTARYAYMRALCVSGVPAVDGAWFDIQNGVVATKGSGITSTSITPAPNGFYRIVMTATTPAVVINQLWDLRTGNADGAQTSVNGETMTFFGAQVEAGAFATSLIQSTTGIVTRSADVATMTGTNFSSWYNATQGTFVSQFTPSNILGTSTVLDANDTTANESTRLRTVAADPFFVVTDGGVDQANIDAGTVAANTTYRMAGAYALNDFAASIGGGAAVTDASGTLPTVTQLQIGNSAAGARLNGCIRSITYYNTRLANATLQSLTT